MCSPEGSPMSPILFILYVSDVPQAFNAQVNLSQFADLQSITTMWFGHSVQVFAVSTLG